MVEQKRRAAAAKHRSRSRGTLAVVASLAAVVIVMFGADRRQSALAAGAVSLTAPGVAYTQNFNTLALVGTSSTTPPGWEFSETGANANTTYTADTGAVNAGDTYSYGAAASSDRAFGMLLSGSLSPVVGAVFTNNTGGTISSLDVSYTGEQWRLGQNTGGRATDRLDFQLSTDAVSVTTGTWIDYNALDFASPIVAGTVGALDGNAAPNRTVVTFTITGLSIANGATFAVRWTDFDLAPGADDGLAIDDFSLTPQNAASGPLAALKTAILTSGAGGTIPWALASYLRSAATYLTFNRPTWNSAACQQLLLFKVAVSVAMRVDPVAASQGAGWIASADAVRAAIPCLVVSVT